MKDHDSYANKAWGGFCGQVIGDEARIWIEPEGERKTEKENRCLTFQSRKKVEHMSQERLQIQMLLCSAADPTRGLNDKPKV